jgi:hypothetical protein
MYWNIFFRKSKFHLSIIFVFLFTSFGGNRNRSYKERKFDAFLFFFAKLKRLKTAKLLISSFCKNFRSEYQLPSTLNPPTVEMPPAVIPFSISVDCNSFFNWIDVT